MTKCHRCNRRGTYMAVVRGLTGEARLVETCGYHRKITNPQAGRPCLGQAQAVLTQAQG